ncbi:hypothetical protein DM02DRAFT_619548 [Periconia macrospinosa]|uniref:Uncharacterized protein n=1 Tax=Periconia macrospinosa TaxID=97972 RepID=A0A2V1D4Z5_9PLEO|nr:hypothetical protein DM02DRAFT_619548 [Periconia macrospinosa]
MATAQTQKASWLTWLVAGLAAVAQAQTTTTSASGSTRTVSVSSTTRTRTSAEPFWTATIRMMESTSTYGYTYTYTYRSTTTSTDRYRTTATRTIKSGVTPSATPYSTSTYIGLLYDDVKQVYAYYTDGVVAESDLEPTYDRSNFYTRTSTSSTSVVYIMPVTWTAPPSCSSTTFSVTDTITPDIPSIVKDQVTPTSKATSTRSGYSTYVVETWYLSASAAPSTSEYSYRSYVALCTAPPVSNLRSGGGSSSGGDSSSDIEWCTWYGGCTGIRVWIIVVASIIPGLFVLGFIESYFWFRRLMLGKGALRVGTICWIMLSLWVICFTRSQSKRSAEDQKLLRENWNKTSTGQAFKLWLKWGFKQRYPVPLLGQYSRNTVGIVPEGQTLPQMGQTNVAYPGFQPQPPPGAVGVPGAPPPAIIYHNGQPYYSAAPPPPQGWAPGAAPTQPQQPYTEAYAQAKDPSTVSVSPIQQSASPAPPPSNVPSTTGPTPPPPAGYVEAFAPPAREPAPQVSPPASELHSASGAIPAPQGPPREDPPAPPKNT